MSGQGWYRLSKFNDRHCGKRNWLSKSRDAVVNLFQLFSKIAPQAVIGENCDTYHR